MTCFVDTDKIYEGSSTMRSVGDIFRTAKYYLPKTSLEEVYQTLSSLINRGSLSSWICSKIGMRVYFKSSYYGYFNSEPVDEFMVNLHEFFGLGKDKPDHYGRWGDNEHYGTENTINDLRIINL